MRRWWRENAWLTASCGCGFVLRASHGWLLPGSLRQRTFCRSLQSYSSAACFGQTDSNGLFGVGGSMFAFSNVVHFLANIFAPLGELRKKAENRKQRYRQSDGGCAHTRPSTLDLEAFMPEKETLERAREDAREGKSPSTQAGEFLKR
jgi:hypothetical protein